MLTDLTVFNDFTRLAATEVLAQQVELFNQASRGTITLVSAANVGDYTDKVFWKNTADIVRRRNAYGTGTVASKKLQNLTDTMVKVASGTPPIEIDPSQFTWIQVSPETAGAVIGQQLAGAMLADMLNTAVLGAYAAMIQTSAILYDATSDTPDTLTHSALNKAAAKFGDRSQAITAWITHSTPYHNLINNNLANAQQLFKFGDVVVNTDAVGRPFIITDTPSLINTTPNPDTYHVLGLVQDAVRVEQNNDFYANLQVSNGNENISRSYQAEWTYNLGIKGYSWDKTNGGHSPNDAAIGTSTNWDKYASSDKDGPGVVLRVDFA